MQGIPGPLACCATFPCWTDGLHVAGLLDAYATRIDQLEQSPPEPGWNGVYTAESK